MVVPTNNKVWYVWYDKVHIVWYISYTIVPYGTYRTVRLNNNTLLHTTIPTYSYSGSVFWSRYGMVRSIERGWCSLFWESAAAAATVVTTSSFFHVNDLVDQVVHVSEVRWKLTSLLPLLRSPSSPAQVEESFQLHNRASYHKSIAEREGRISERFSYVVRDEICIQNEGYFVCDEHEVDEDISCGSNSRLLERQQWSIILSGRYTLQTLVYAVYTVPVRLV